MEELESQVKILAETSLELSDNEIMKLKKDLNIYKIPYNDERKICKLIIKFAHNVIKTRKSDSELTIKIPKKITQETKFYIESFQGKDDKELSHIIVTNFFQLEVIKKAEENDTKVVEVKEKITEVEEPLKLKKKQTIEKLISIGLDMENLEEDCGITAETNPF